jgi:hypothetical protein
MRLPLFVPAQRPALYESGPTPLREADVDDIEVLRNDRLREDGPRLADDLGSEVTVGEVREGEKTDARRGGKLRRGRRRRVQGLVRALALLHRERGLVNEHVGVPGGLAHRVRGARVAGEDDLPPGPRRAENLLGAHCRAVGQLQALAALQATKKRALGHAATSSFVEVEAPWTRFLDKCVAVRRHAVLDLERLDSVVAPIDAVSRAELDQRELVAEPAEHAPEDPEEIVEPRWAVDRERHLAPAQSERLQHPRQSEVVVRMVVREEDLGQLDEPDGRAQELALRTFPAVDEYPLAAAAKQRARETAPSGRHRAGSSEEDDIEVHTRSLGATGLKSDRAQADFHG